MAPAAWRIKPRHSERETRLRAERIRLPLQDLSLRLLAQRGLQTADEVMRYLKPESKHLHDPYRIDGMRKAVDRIRRAVQDQEPILIHGDYDVDGVTGTSLLVQFFRLLNANVRAFLPHRVEDGYSLQTGNVKQFAADGVKLIITVDCGITSISEIDYAQSLGVDVIVTDHHTYKETLPPAFALLSPNLPNTGYPFPYLCGCGMAFKLAWALAEAFSPGKKLSEEFRAFLRNALGLVSIGTIADVVPLTEENRFFVRHGLDALRTAANPGLRALLEGANLDGAKSISVTDIGFRLAPRINAAGRMGSAMTALHLLTSTDTGDCRRLEAEISRANDRRKETEREILELAREQARTFDMASTRVLVVADTGWHPGVIGIVAARLAEEFHRPTIVIAMGKEKGKGSGRSVPRFHLLNAVTAAASHLLGFGGHAFAAGLEIAPDKVDDFRDAINAHVAGTVTDQELTPTLDIDMEVEFGELTLGFLKELSLFEPYGNGNEAPLFLTRNVRSIGAPRLVGQTNKHLVAYLQHRNVSLKAIAFNRADALSLVMNTPLDIVYAAKLNEWQGSQTVEIELKDFHPAGAV